MPPGLSFTIILERHMLYKILVCRLICTVPPPSDSIVSSGYYSKLNIFLEKGTQMAKTFASLFRSTFFSTVRQHLLSNCRERCQTFSPRCRGPPASEIKVFPNFRRTGGNSAWALTMQKKRTGLRQTGKTPEKYEDVSISPGTINAMHTYDWEAFLAHSIYSSHTQALSVYLSGVTEDDRSTLFQKYPLPSVSFDIDDFSGRYSWIETISDAHLTA